MSLTRRTPTFGLHLFLFSLFLLSLLGFSSSRVALAQQEGASSAAASRTRSLAQAGMIPASRDVVVEEIVNYHRHQIGRPTAGEAVNMDVRWGNDPSGFDREAVLQIGFSTALASDREQLRPLNLALVIDKSGSMAAADKLSRVKTALLELVSRLRDTDTISIVVFDSSAEVLVPSCHPSDRSEINRLIRQLEPGSSTNIHSGLMLGYQEAMKHFRKDGTNRVILLTDGIANQGVTDPSQIARDSLGFNDQGVDLSTIGVGSDLNEDLLRQLAKSGRGLFHFVAESQDIQKVFVNEVQSLVSPVATDPNLTIEYEAGLELVQLYGYDPQLRKQTATIKLDNMNSGLTEVVLMRFKPASRTLNQSRMSVRVRLSYYDLERKKQVVKTSESFLNLNDDARGDMLKDNEVSKNYSIAVLAQAIRDMAAACEAQNYRQAEKVLNAAIASTYQRYPHLEDEDITRTLLVAQKYQEVIRNHQRESAKNDR